MYFPLCPLCLRVSRNLLTGITFGEPHDYCDLSPELPVVWFWVPERFRVITPSAAAQLQQRSPTQRESPRILAEHRPPCIAHQFKLRLRSAGLDFPWDRPTYSGVRIF